MKATDMTDQFQDLTALIAEEEKAASAHAIGQRIIAIEGQPDGPIRARIFAAVMLIGAAELWAQLEDGETVAHQLRRLADRFDGIGQPRH
jgi:hypothetical protein